MSKLRQAIRNANRAKTALVGGSLSALMVMGMASAASAQEDAVLEEVVVTGIKGSLKKSIDTKRFADSIVDAISAEDIGKFPDKNVADSLARITGVSVTRGFGEGEKIAVRGTSPEQNRTLLNGSAVASADWFVLDNPSRAFNYTLLPSTVVSSLEVYKSPQADIQEGSLGGTVYLRTRRPLEMDANSGSIQLQTSYSDNSEEWDPLVSGMYSWKNEAETFGVMVSATKQDRTVQREGTEVLGWEQQSVAGQDLWAPRAIGDAHFVQERERETFLVTAQWAPDEKQNLVVNYLDSELEANNSNYNNYVWIKDQLGQGVTINDAKIKNGAAVGGEVSLLQTLGAEHTGAGGLVLDDVHHAQPIAAPGLFGAGREHAHLHVLSDEGAAHSRRAQQVLATALMGGRLGEDVDGADRLAPILGDEEHGQALQIRRQERRAALVHQVEAHRLSGVEVPIGAADRLGDAHLALAAASEVADQQ